MTRTANTAFVQVRSMIQFWRHLLVLSIIIASVLSESVQYCENGQEVDGHAGIDFCVGAHMWHNKTANNHDLYLTLVVRRPQGTALGWTAVGTGVAMDGALMFIVYGDPTDGHEPIVSIRTTSHHQQPKLLVQSDMPAGMDLRVLSARWFQEQGRDKSHNNNNNNNDIDGASGPTAHFARIHIVCYSCSRWPGAGAVSAQRASQPMMWAWNDKQALEVFAFDARLDMHRHHAGAGGWGNFYLDLARSVSEAPFPPSLPPIRPGVTTLGASARPLTAPGYLAGLMVGPGSVAHGAMLALTFLLLFPMGVAGLRSGSSRAYTLHWVVQIIASAFLIVGVALGVNKSRRKINTAHQYVGIALVCVIGVQGLLGLWHHRRFVRLSRRTWVSHVHIWAGRLIMVAGAGNVVGGLLLRGYASNSTVVVLAAVLIASDAVILVGVVWWNQRKARLVAGYHTTANPSGGPWSPLNRSDVFALSLDEDDEDDDGDDDDAREMEVESEEKGEAADARKRATRG